MQSCSKIGCKKMNSFLTESQSTLPAFRITHPVHPDSVSDLNITHILRSDQNILFLVGRIRSVNLPCGETRKASKITLKHTIIRMLMRRLTASMKTSNSSEHMLDDSDPEPRLFNYRDNVADNQSSPTAREANRWSRTTSRHH